MRMALAGSGIRAVGLRSTLGSRSGATDWAAAPAMACRGACSRSRGAAGSGGAERPRGAAGLGGTGAGAGGRDETPPGGDPGAASGTGGHQDSESGRGAASGADGAGEPDRAVPGWSAGDEPAWPPAAAGTWGTQRRTGPSSGFPSRTTHSAPISIRSSRCGPRNVPLVLPRSLMIQAPPSNSSSPCRHETRESVMTMSDFGSRPMW